MIQGEEDEWQATPRAYESASFQEEKHAIMGKAHLILAAKTRYDQLWDKEMEEAYTLLWQDFDENLQVASPEVLADREAMLLAMSASGSEFHRCSLELRNDPEVALAAFSTYPQALQDASDQIRRDREAMRKAMAINGEGLWYASQGLKNDKELVLAAVESHPPALDYASETLKSDRDVMLTAVQNQTSEGIAEVGWNVLILGDEELRNDKEIVLESVKIKAASVALAGSKLRRDKDFLLQAMREAPHEERHWCYYKADRSVREAMTLKDFQSALKSGIASAGETAPVVTVSPELELENEHCERRCGGSGDSSSSGDADSDGSGSGSHRASADGRARSASTRASSTSGESNSSLGKHPAWTHSGVCRVTLLSGTTFTCDCSSQPLCPSTKMLGASSCSSSRQRRRRCRRSPEADVDGYGDDRQQSLTSLTVSRLAEAVLAELPKQAEIDPPAERIFIVFAKLGGDGDGEVEGIAVTPWDWSRSVADFF